MNLIDQRQLPGGDGQGEGDQKALRFKGAAGEAGAQLLVHDPLVEGVLVDDDHSFGGFGDEVAVVELNGGGGGWGGREWGGEWFVGDYRWVGGGREIGRGGEGERGRGERGGGG